MKNRTKPYSIEFCELIIVQYNSGQSDKNLSTQFDVSQVSIYIWLSKLNIKKNY